MRILFVLDSLTRAGTEKSTLELIEYLKEGHEVGLLYFYPNHALKQAAEALGIAIFYADLQGKFSLVTGIFFLKRLVAEFSPDLVVSSLFRSNLMSRIVSAQSRIPLVGTLVSDSYGPQAYSGKANLVKMKFKFFWLLDRLTAAIPVKFIANSQSIATSHNQTLGIPMKKMKVVYRGRKPPEKAWVPLHREAYRFIAVGRLIPLKGFRDLIEAFVRIRKRKKKVELIILGEGPDRNYLEKMIENHGLHSEVVLKGSVENPVSDLMQADCFVFPSHYEGFSGALVEAMMLGIPIIASDIPMNLEAIIPDFNGLVFKCKEIDSLTEKMSFAESNKDLMMLLGSKARVEALLRFDIEKIAKEYEQELIEVVGKN